MQQPEPRTVFATDIFIREMKRQWAKQHPTADPAECPVGLLSSYNPRQRSALITAIQKAIEASKGMDDAYEAWIKMMTETKT